MKKIITLFSVFILMSSCAGNLQSAAVRTSRHIDNGVEVAVDTYIAGRSTRIERCGKHATQEQAKKCMGTYTTGLHAKILKALKVYDRSMKEFGVVVEECGKETNAKKKAACVIETQEKIAGIMKMVRDFSRQIGSDKLLKAIGGVK